MQDLDEDLDSFFAIGEEMQFWRSKWSQTIWNNHTEQKIVFKIHQSQNIFLSNILMFAAFVKESILSWIYMIVRQSWLVSCVDCLALGFFYFWKREA